MAVPAWAESAFQHFITDLTLRYHNEIVLVDSAQLALYRLSETDLLAPPDDKSPFCYFHVAEASEKLTLINDRFVAWILPMWHIFSGQTLLIVAGREPGQLVLKSVLALPKTCNSPNAALKVLERVLIDVRENDLYCKALGKSSHL